MVRGRQCVSICYFLFDRAPIYWVLVLSACSCSIYFAPIYCLDFLSPFCVSFSVSMYLSPFSAPDSFSSLSAPVFKMLVCSHCCDKLSQWLCIHVADAGLPRVPLSMHVVEQVLHVFLLALQARRDAVVLRCTWGHHATCALHDWRDKPNVFFSGSFPGDLVDQASLQIDGEMVVGSWSDGDQMVVIQWLCANKAVCL